jgi:hypothetical protein
MWRDVENEIISEKNPKGIPFKKLLPSPAEVYPLCLDL